MHVLCHSGRIELDVLCSLTASCGRAASLCFMADRNCCFAANKAVFMSTALTSPLIGAMLWEGEHGLRHAQPAGHVKVRFADLVGPGVRSRRVRVDQVPAMV